MYLNCWSMKSFFVRLGLMLPVLALMPMAATAQDKAMDEMAGEASTIECLSLHYQTVSQAVAEATKNARAAPGFRGMFVGVIDAGHEQSFYYGKTINNQTVGAKSIFEIGSISKTFTATLLALLDSRHQIHVSDGSASTAPETKLADVLGQSTSCVLPAARQPITLAELADHHSGLPRKPPDVTHTVNDLWHDLCGSAAADTPRAQYLYSNYAFSVLGHVLAPIYGTTTWREANRKAILEPLKMNDTMPWESLTANQQQSLQGYTRSESFPVANPAGGLYSTPDDMMKFLAFNMADPPSACHLGDAACELRMLLPLLRLARAKGAHGNGSVGLAWQINPASKCSQTNVLWKDGAVTGFHSYIGYEPATKRGVIVLMNYNFQGDSPGKIGNTILTSMP